MNPAAPTIVFSAPEHTYDVDGVRLPSVTQILRPIQGYIPKALMEEGARRGIAVHQGCEFIDAGFDDDVDPIAVGYCRGYKRFLAETKAVVLKSEYRVANPPAKYAGTIDRVIRWGDDIFILDIKTGEMQVWMRLQLAAYAYGYWLMESGDPKVRLPKCAVLALDEGGGYQVHEYKGVEEAFGAFLGLARYSRWLEANS